MEEFDKNSDGVITKKEYIDAMENRFKEIDENHHGYITRGEALKYCQKSKYLNIKRNPF